MAAADIISLEDVDGRTCLHHLLIANVCAFASPAEKTEPKALNEMMGGRKYPVALAASGS